MKNISCKTIPCFLRSGFSRWEAGKAQIGTASVGLFGALVALCLDSEVWLLLTLLMLLLMLVVVVVMLLGLFFVGDIAVLLFFFLSDNLQYLESNSDNLQCLERRTAWILPFSAGGFLNIGRVSQ